MALRNARMPGMGSAAFAVLVSLSSGSSAAEKTEIIRFDPGASSKSIKGSVKGDDGHRYVVGANGGQAISILFVPDNDSCYFNLLPPVGDAAIFIGSAEGNEYANVLPATGNYTVDVYLMRNAARRAESCDYTLTVEISD
ncbi:hypothetical protein [Sinorhizobium sp. BG8]|uniref:hypothetical protein n=1 Tax=Sinorhizobium sp. BG8 TaxID=2613773 RepID=UPI00193DB419|nr:hypothetical protein [Sinorhizobium sp. BG8]QRM54170.1 DNA breaking-rejoining protein [Sinorhizobium sp. BG8]